MREFEDLEDEMAAMDIVVAAPPTMEGLLKVAEAVSGGHVTVMKFTTNWRVGFETPNSWGDNGKVVPKAADAVPVIVIEKPSTPWSWRR